VKAYQAKHGRVADGFRFLLQGLDIRNATDRADLVQAVRAAGWNGGVLCLDTLNRAAPGMDENDSKSMGEAIGAAKAIQAELGGLVLLVHHTGKDATKGLRGHSSLHAALDAAIEVTRTDDRREWKVAKSKDGEDGERIRSGWTWWRSARTKTASRLQAASSCQTRARAMPCAG
jgi:hypothetical protein